MVPQLETFSRYVPAYCHKIHVRKVKQTMKMFFLYGCSYPSKMSCIILKFLWVLAKGKCESNWHLSYCQALSFSSFYRFQLCQAISCSGLCFIATSCAQYLPVNAIKFVLLALKTVLKIVGNPSKCSNAFVYQVTSWFWNLENFSNSLLLLLWKVLNSLVAST